MKKILHCLILVLLFYSSASYPQVVQQWVQQNNSMGSGFKDIHLDASGNIYVLGKSPETDSVNWTCLASYSPSGQERFSIVDNYASSFSGWFTDLKGNIYIAGQYAGVNNSGYWSISKYDSTGIKLWSTADYLAKEEILKGFTGDKDGNSFLLINSPERNTILKYDSRGTFMQMFYLNEIFYPCAFTIHPQGGIIISGVKQDEQSTSCLTVKYSSSGMKQWQTGYEIISGIIETGKYKIKIYNNDIYLVLSASFYNGIDYAVIKYSSEGNLSWAAHFDKVKYDFAEDLAVDSRNNVIVTGSSGTVKFNKKGMTLWSDTTCNINSAAIDKQNNIYLTGENTVRSGDMVTLKLNTDGKRIWTQYYKGPNILTVERGLAIAVDTLLNVYSCGFQNNYPNLYGTGTLIKYKQFNIDTAALRFMPLAFGNSWVFKITSGDTSYYYRSVIRKDTIADGKRYFYVPYFPLTGYSNWLRTDTINGNLFAFLPSFNCANQTHEKIVDSLVSGKQDTIRDCSSNEFKTCIDTGSINFWNRSIKFKQFKSSSQNVQSRCYARGIGIYSINSGDVTPVISSLKGCEINGVIYGDTVLRYSVTGRVLYKDNHQPVSYGKVKALKYNSLTGQIIVVDSAIITSTGTYRLNNVLPDSCDIMAYQDDELNDIVPGFRDSTIYWQSANTIAAGPNANNIDIYVERNNALTGNDHVMGHIYSMNAGSNSMPLDNTRIYVKSGNEFINFDISNSSGKFIIDSVQSGVYTFIVDRIGYYPQIRQVDLSLGSLDTVDFYLQKYSGIERDITLVPAKFSLIQNYPNPFNPSTTFTFDIPGSSNVRLTIYDITGREICRLINKKLNTGRYKIVWDATAFASGVYLYRLEAGDFTEGSTTGFSETKKLVLMK